MSQSPAGWLPQTVFVMMPFSPDFDDVYSTIRDSAATVGASIKVTRLDEIQAAGSITEDLLAEIRRSTICLADVTGTNPNVMWELGFATALGKPIVAISQSDKLPFDIKDVRTLAYSRSSLSRTLRDPLAEVLEATLERYASRRDRQQEEGRQLTEALLDGVLDLIRAQNRRPIYRSLVAIANHQAGTREVVATSHLSTDPELHMSKPIDFGVAGEAFITRSVRAADVDDTNRDLARDGTHVMGIWPETRSVLAFPMIASDNAAFGTLNFDSNDTLAASRLGNRSLQEALSQIAGVVTYLMRSYSESGEAPMPG
jgi:nucleoside 2-deoxyribosyltransferase